MSDHQGASHATTSEDNAGAGYFGSGKPKKVHPLGRSSLFRCRRHLPFLLDDDCQRHPGHHRRGHGQKLQPQRPKKAGGAEEAEAAVPSAIWSEPLTRWMSFLFRGCFAG